ncbi:vascular endothelial growth factor receptor 1-like [Planococcus citri]|uniref:vascular endothelial growth factor receptor 1-like n=1 Tax=Planococcus citri TaxID=170843 RepID=UPI0031F78826
MTKTLLVILLVLKYLHFVHSIADVSDEPQINLKGYYQGFRLFKINTTYHFECTSTGYPIPQIKWSAKICEDHSKCKNNGTFQRIPQSMHEERVKGTRKVISTLHFMSNQSEIVQCEANNSLGFANISFPFLVTDYENSTAVVIKNYSASIIVGEDVEIMCAVPKYYYYNSFEWMYTKNLTRTSQKKRVTPATEIRIQNSTTYSSYISTLFIKNVQKNQTGIYICQTSVNRVGNFWVHTNSSSVNLTVLEPKPPTIIHSMMKNGVWQVHQETSVHILIQVDGIPSPSVIWYKNEKPVPLSNRITLSNDSRNLSIANMSPEDEGMYSFVASNMAGNVTDRIHLSIKAPEENKYLFHIGIIIIISISSIGMVTFYFARKLYRQKMKLQKVLKEYGLEHREGSVTTNLDPDLNISEQTFFISYNKKYNFPRKKLEFGGVLGSGSFGVVHKAEADGIRVKGLKTTVAVKMAKHGDELCLKALTSEMKIMIYLGDHINVVQLLGACPEDLADGELLIIVEYCKHGNLRDFLSKRRNQFVNQVNKNDEIDLSIITPNFYENIPRLGKPQLNETATLEKDPTIGNVSNDQHLKEMPNDNVAINTTNLICWSYQLARGMEFLASRKVLHGDLAARNVLLTEDGIVKVGDFGFAKNMSFKENYQSSKTFLPIKWLAIETLREKLFSTQSDVWAFGITLWELFSLAVTPYPGIEKDETLFNKLVSGYRMAKPRFATNKIYELMMSCWEHHSKDRPSFTKLSEILGTLLEDPAPAHSQNTESVDSVEDDVSEYTTTSDLPVSVLSENQVHRHQLNSSPGNDFELSDVSKNADSS